MPPSSSWYLDPEVPVPWHLRVLWWPASPVIAFAAMLLSVVTFGMTWSNVVGLVIDVAWLALNIHNHRTGGAFLRKLYTPDEPPVPTAHVVEPKHRQKP